MGGDDLVLIANIKAKFDETSLRQESQKAGGLMAQILQSNFGKGLVGGALGRNFEARTTAGQIGVAAGVVSGLALLGTAVFFLKKIFGAIVESSGFLRATLGIFQTALGLILMVLGNVVGRALLPIAKFLLKGASWFVAATGAGLPPKGTSTLDMTGPDYNPEHPANVFNWAPYVNQKLYEELSDQMLKTSKESITSSFGPSKFSSFWEFLVDFLKAVIIRPTAAVLNTLMPSVGATELSSSPYAGLSGLDLINAPGSEGLSWKTGAASVASKSQVDQILAHYNTVFQAMVGNAMGESFASALAAGATGGGITGDQALNIWQTTGSMPAGTLWDEPWVKANLGHFLAQSGYGLTDPAQLAAQAVNLQRPGFFSFLQDILPVAAGVGSTLSPILSSIIQAAQGLGGNLGNVPLDMNFPGGQAGDLMKFWGGYTNLTGGTAYQTTPFSGFEIGQGGTITVKVYIGTTEITDIIRTEIEKANFLASTAVS